MGGAFQVPVETDLLYILSDWVDAGVYNRRGAFGFPAIACLIMCWFFSIPFDPNNLWLIVFDSQLIQDAIISEQVGNKKQGYFSILMLNLRDKKFLNSFSILQIELKLQYRQMVISEVNN